MRIGIYQDLRDPERWSRGWEYVYGAALERARQAEDVGLDSVWCSEHHFFEDGYLPQPLTWAAALAARTDRVAIGTAIVIAPLHKPLEIAEQAAVVDQLSGGRLHLGLGAGYVPREFRAFEVDLGRRFETTERNVVETKRLLDERVVRPPSLRQPMPIWFGGFGPRGARFAGREGLGLLALDSRRLAGYREGLEEGGRDPASGAMAGLATMIVSEDPERAWARLRPHLDHQRASYQRAATEGSEGPITGLFRTMPGDDNPDRFRSSGPVMVPPKFDAVEPAEAVRRLREWLGEMPVSEVYFWDSVGGMPDDMVEEHIRLLANVRHELRDLAHPDPDLALLRRGSR